MREAHNIKRMKVSAETNVIGALALALADDIIRSTERNAPEIGPAAAALTLIGHEPGLSINELRAGVGLSHPGAVRLVDRMVEAGMVARLPAKHDRRAVALTLTPGGQAACDAIMAGRNGALVKGLAALDKDERHTLGLLASKMLRTILRDENHAYQICRLCDFGRCEDCPVDSELEARADPA